MIYTTNWIERLQRTFRRVLRFRTALPNEQSALTLRQNSHGYKMLSAKDIPDTLFGTLPAKTQKNCESCAIFSGEGELFRECWKYMAFWG